MLRTDIIIVWIMAHRTFLSIISLLTSFVLLHFHGKVEKGNIYSNSCGETCKILFIDYCMNNVTKWILELGKSRNLGAFEIDKKLMMKYVRLCVHDKFKLVLVHKLLSIVEYTWSNIQGHQNFITMLSLAKQSGWIAHQSLWCKIHFEHYGRNGVEWSCEKEGIGRYGIIIENLNHGHD